MAGRPTSYEPQFADLLIEHMEQGYGVNSFVAFLRTKGHQRARSTIFAWKQEDHESYQPEFAEAYEVGQSCLSYFWEKQGIDGLYSTTEKLPDGGSITKSLNTGVYAINVRNKIGWHDKLLLQGDKDKPVSFTLNYSLDDEKSDASE